MSLPVKFSPLEMEADVGESEPYQTDDGRDDRGEYYDDEYGRDDGRGEYDDDEYQYPYDDDNEMNDFRDAVPLVGSTTSASLHESVETLVDPERRAICWPVYLVVALCIGLLTAAVVLVPPADESNTASSAPSASPSASPSVI
jgi:hypothetical protein